MGEKVTVKLPKEFLNKVTFFDNKESREEVKKCWQQKVKKSKGDKDLGVKYKDVVIKEELLDEDTGETVKIERTVKEPVFR